jgi:hypothetical protein
MREEALRYADLGYPVFPCRPGLKTPITKHGLLDASTDHEQIERWWTAYPDANVAIRTDGLLVIDIDGTGEGWLGDQDDRWMDLAAALSSKTPRGGRHYLFRRPPGKTWRNTQSELGPKVDTRTDGGYIVAPPSVFNGSGYSWLEGYELEASPDRLPEPPAWLIQQLDRSSAAPTTVTTSKPTAEQIPEGKRNAALTSMAGALRRLGLSQQEMAAALHQVNTDRCVPSLDSGEVNRIAASVARYEPNEIAAAIAEGRLPRECEDQPAKPKSIRELMDAYPSLREPVVHNLLRRGETMNVISAPKAGKSWLMTDLALAVVSKRMWLGKFQTVSGDVLILGNELHGETIAHRIPKVALARNIPIEAVEDRLFVLNLRGQLKDLFSLRSYFDSLEPRRFSLIILDAFYRFMPRNMDENDNGTMASLYNQLDSYADRLGCCFVLIHHTSKGSQSAKSITDVGAGAGSQSRATDTHLILRPHEEPGAVVLDAAVRSWPPVPAQCLRWAFPVWMPANDLDPTLLRREKPKRAPERDASVPSKEQVGDFARRFVTDQPQTKSTILQATTEAGMSGRRAQGLLRAAEDSALVHRWNYGSHRPVQFATVPKPSGKETNHDRA